MDILMDGGISIHAPRVGSDSPPVSPRLPRWHFNPRSPCGERLTSKKVYNGQESISIHAPRVGSDWMGGNSVLTNEISIHAPRVGSDDIEDYLMEMEALFQSTLPVWGATYRGLCMYGNMRISIHAPRVGSDHT